MPAISINGTAHLVAMFRSLSQADHRQLTAVLQASAPHLAQLVADCRFLYSDLGRLRPASLVKALSLIPEERWLVAWKLTADEQRQLILAHLSPARRGAFLKAAAALPPMPRTQVIKTQLHIGRTLQQLLAAGDLFLTTP